MPNEIDELKKIGLGLIGFGVFFTFLGVFLFFDRGLLALGNVFLLMGLAVLLGCRSTLNLFVSRSNYKLCCFHFLAAGFYQLFAGFILFICWMACAWYPLGSLWMFNHFKGIWANDKDVHLSDPSYWMGSTLFLSRWLIAGEHQRDSLPAVVFHEEFMCCSGWCSTLKLFLGRR